jgi:hypothetical protein
MRVTGQMRQGPRGEVGLDAGGAAGFRASRGPHRGFRRLLPAQRDLPCLGRPDGAIVAPQPVVPKLPSNP